MSAVIAASDRDDHVDGHQRSTLAYDGVPDPIRFHPTRKETLPMATWFDLTKSSDGKFRFALRNDGGTLLSSEAYEAKSSAQQGIASVQTNAALPERCERKTASDGRFYFNLKAANGQVVGTSPMFTTEAAREGAVAATQSGAAGAEVRDAS
ncbi:MAG TPA: YegP family protein [Rubrivivax sp.]|nr:YegP family protein [Rubrivivax sp.]